MKRRPTLERLWEKVDAGSSDECWPWTAATNRGHPVFGDGTPRRIVYEADIGPIPHEHVITMVCGNRACLNPTHMAAVPRVAVLGPATEAGAAVQAAKTECPHGHPYSEENTRRVAYRSIGNDGIERTRYRRYCRTCGREDERRRRERRRKSG